MNKRIIFVIYIVILFCSEAASQSGWELVAPNPPLLPQVYSTAVTGNKAYFWCNGNTVFSTSNGGNTFAIYPNFAPLNNVENGSYPMQGIAFADSLTGYIADIAHGEFRTKDGGWTWTQKADPGSNISLVKFGSSKIGWKLGWGGFYRTTDAGETWKFISSPLFGDLPGSDGNFSKICTLNENDIWILKTNQSSTGKPGPIWHSTDGGFNWANIFTGLHSDSLNQITYENFDIRSSGVGILTGTIYTPTENFDSICAVVLTTTDFGVSWKSQEFANEDYSDIISINDKAWILLGNTRPHSYNDWGQSIRRRTTDTGNSWAFSYEFGSDTLQNQHFYKSVYIPKLNAILAATVKGTYKSTDQGISFSKLASERDVLVNFISIDKSSKSKTHQVIICPSYGLDYLISNNSGESWIHKHLPGYLMYPLRDLKIANEKIYQLVYDYQSTFAVAYSTDLGESWSSSSVPSYGALRGLAVSEKNTIVMQAYPNFVLSANGGETWSQAPMQENFWINETQIVGDRKIVAVGGFYDTTSTKGFVYVSTDAGYNWRIEDFPAELDQIKMITYQIGFAVGKDSKLFHTTDGGKTWNISLTGVNSFAFFDSYNGITSNLQVTTNAGATWKESGLSFPFANNFTSMEFNNSGDLFASANGNLFKYSNAVSLFPSSSLKQNLTYTHKVLLNQNNPNPFNPTTTISFSLPSVQYIQLKVYNILGEEVNTLLNTTLTAGKHSVVFDGSNLPSGVYFYKLSAGSFSEVKKMLLVK